MLIELGELLAKYKEWKDCEVIKMCKETMFDNLYKGFVSIKGEERAQKKSTKTLSKDKSISLTSYILLDIVC